MEIGGYVKTTTPTVKKTRIGARPGRRYNYCKKIDNASERDLYSNFLSFYDIPPDCTISLTEFEKYALARLKVLRLIERLNLTSVGQGLYTQVWRDAVLSEMRKAQLSEFSTLLTNIEDHETVLECRKFDHISHYLLRLAFSRTEEQRKWFTSMEIDMFRLKLLCSNKPEINRFLKNHDFPGKEVDMSELGGLLGKDIRAASFAISKESIDNMNIYKIPFVYGLDLVRQRKVLLRNGNVYVPYKELMSVLSGSFRSYLSESLSMLKKNMHLVEQDQRIVQIVEDFDRRHTGSDYVPKKGSVSGITAEQLPTLSLKSFPLCMKSLYEVVVKEHHLKHWGRLQLGLFFKGIGVPLAEATKFWRGHFTKKPEIDGQRFDKQYLYNIRHMYGQEGKRADYTPYSCMKVITSSIGPGDHHGCPFKHSDAAHLRSKLIDAEIPSKGVKEIVDLVDNQHYQLACQKYFEWTHDKLTVDGGVNHPNQYFEESRDALSGKKTLKAEEKAKTTRTLVYPDGSSQQVSQGVKKEENTEESTVEESMDIDDDNELLSLVKW